MGLLDKFRKSRQRGQAEKTVDVDKDVIVKKEEGPVKPTSQKAKKSASEDTGRAYHILIRPLVTEKATNLSAQGKYVFMVSSDANKTEIKKAIKNVYGVDPIAVNIINMSGKWSSYGRYTGRTKNWQKAIITLKPGEKIEIYEGV